MPKKQSKRLMMLFSIVEREKGKKLTKTLNSKNINMHFQFVGFGTAPSEMMDIFGLGNNDKDIIISLAPEIAVKNLMSDFGNNFSNYSEYGGLMIVLKMSAVNRLVAEILNHNPPQNTSKEKKSNMKNEHNHQLIFISVDQGYSDLVMQTAKRAGATGGTVMKGRLAESDYFIELSQVDIKEEREMICILAPDTVSGAIMESVNEKFGLTSSAHGVICSVPIEKAYKI